MSLLRISRLATNSINHPCFRRTTIHRRLLEEEQRRRRHSLVLGVLPQQQEQYSFLPSYFTGSGKNDNDDEEERSNQTLRLRSLSMPQQQQQRSYHTTVTTERAAAIIMGLGAISAGAFAAASGVKAYREWVASLPEEPPEEEKNKADEQVKDDEEQTRASSKQQQQQEEEGERENIFAKWLNSDLGAKYYEGGFEEKMTPQEAARILGVRQSSSAARIKEAHRKLLMRNHPGKREC